MVYMTSRDPKKIVADYEAAVERARAKRDERIRAALRAGVRQVDIVAATGYSRETIRRIAAAEPGKVGE
jgi:hypothetical protein